MRSITSKPSIQQTIPCLDEILDLLLIRLHAKQGWRLPLRAKPLPERLDLPGIPTWAYQLESGDTHSEMQEFEAQGGGFPPTPSST